MRIILRRCLILSTILAGTLALCGCSSFADFVLVNMSDETIVVEYHLKRTKSMLLVQLKARLASLHQHRSNPREFNAFPEERLWTSDNGQSARVTLLPKEVLFLTELNQSDIYAEPVFKAGISKLSINRNSGSVTFEGDQVFKQFVPSEYGLFPRSAGMYTLTVEE